MYILIYVEKIEPKIKKDICHLVNSFIHTCDVVRKENRNKEILAWGGRVWKIKLHPTREYYVVSRENHTKEILAWGGRVWKIKLHWTREYDVVTKENRTKKILALGDRVCKIKNLPV